MPDGDFDDSDDLIACAPDGRPYTLDELRAELQRGLDSPVAPLDMARIKRECREQWERERRRVA